MRKRMMILLWAGLLGCVTNPAPETAGHAAEGKSCPFTSFQGLMDTSKVSEASCFANGRRIAAGESAGMLDGCNQSTCFASSSDGHTRLLQTLTSCPQLKPVCYYEDWVFSDCFKFIDKEGRNCSCEQGEVACVAPLK